MTDPSFWNQIFIWPILNVLIALTKGFDFLGLAGSLGWAIISLTVLIRLILYPLTDAQLKSTKKMQELKPHLDSLKEKHGKDRQKLAAAQMQLYKEHGVNPAAGCLPLLLSMPILISLYQVFWKVLSNGNLKEITEQINQIVYFPALKIQELDLYFFGANLAEKPSDWQSVGWWLLLIPPITALLYLVQTKTMVPAGVKKEAPKKAKKEDMEDIMSSMTQGPMSFLFPLMFGFFAYSFPIGLSLYWNTFTILAIIQQYFIFKIPPWVLFRK
ncbi:YidC/Oxa1 family membrane protein insertase [Candidatus Microgenomates bacterium]|nr:YidC/Oxa1 family membrane protein insertase [Candidatus Microgenomates bacterium]